MCLIGAGGVGKTCIVRRLCFDTFSLDTQLTVGIDFYTYNLPIIVDDQRTNVRLSIWDFGGQAHFKTLFDYYIKGANGIFLVFDLFKMQSLLDLDWWYDKLIENAMINQPKIFIGTKFDLVNQMDTGFIIDEFFINDFIKNHGELKFIKTSSKDNVNIIKIFKEMAKKLLDFQEFNYERLL
ncbi:MAG: Rab family GTPase [Candidatus Odinarchaeota archaeon]